MCVIYKMRISLKIKVCNFIWLLLIASNDRCDENKVVSCTECCVHKTLFGDVLEAVDASLPMVKVVVAFGVVVTLATAIAVISVIAVVWCEVALM